MRDFFLSINVYFYVIPIALAISLVYAASRYEAWSPLVRAAARLAGMILGLVLAATIVLVIINH